MATALVAKREIETGQARAEPRKLKREIKKTEKERRKAQEALEKQRRREAADALKRLRPDQCLKYVTVCIDLEQALLLTDLLVCPVEWATERVYKCLGDQPPLLLKGERPLLLLPPWLRYCLQGLVVLQLWGNIEVWFLDTCHELSQHVSALIKTIAKRPYKKQLETQLFSFCTDGGWSSSICVEEDRMGLQQAWKRQIQQFNVSPVVAAAIAATTAICLCRAAAYPSPSLLLHACQECSTEEDRLLLLSDIRVKVSEG
ncbi:LOW QUALITY PROTEIN: putative crossover junction endonuclease EME2 [Macrochelys suwanniensis]